MQANFLPPFATYRWCPSIYPCMGFSISCNKLKIKKMAFDFTKRITTMFRSHADDTAQGGSKASKKETPAAPPQGGAQRGQQNP
ncbi:MAG: hypothetical protein ACRYGK_16985, partial [Janthinobacterium lividum]